MSLSEFLAKERIQMLQASSHMKATSWHTVLSPSTFSLKNQYFTKEAKLSSTCNAQSRLKLRKETNFRVHAEKKEFEPVFFDPLGIVQNSKEKGEEFSGVFISESMNKGEKSSAADSARLGEPSLGKRDSLSSLNSYFDKLKKPVSPSSEELYRQEETERIRLSSEPAITSGKETVESNIERTGEVQSDLHSASAKAEIEQSKSPKGSEIQTTLTSLDKYFDQVHPPPPPPVEPSVKDDKTTVNQDKLNSILAEILENKLQEIESKATARKEVSNERIDSILKRLENENEGMEASPLFEDLSIFSEETLERYRFSFQWWTEQEKLWRESEKEVSASTMEMFGGILRKISVWRRSQVKKRFRELLQADRRIRSVATRRLSDSSEVSWVWAEDGTDFESWINQREKEQRAPVSIGIMVTLSCFFALEYMSPSLLDGKLLGSLPVLALAKVNELVKEGEWWRLITTSFLHPDGLIFAVHMGLLFFNAASVEATLGSTCFLGSVLFGSLFGNLCSYWFNPDITLGATGIIMAVVGARLGFFTRNKAVLEEGGSFSKMVTVDLFLLAFFFLFVGAMPTDDLTHTGALAGGFVYSLIGGPTVNIKDEGQDGHQRFEVTSAEQQQQRLLLALAMLLLVGMFSAKEGALVLADTNIDQIHYHLPNEELFRQFLRY